MSAVPVFLQPGRGLEGVVWSQIQEAKLQLAWLETFTVGKKVGHLIEALERKRVEEKEWLREASALVRGVR